jgi:hypothetical protein
MKFVLALLTAASIAAISAPASATAITAGSGWQADQVNTAATPSINSAWTFTVAGPSVFSVVDCCVVGDVYQLFDGGMSLLATSTFYAGSGVQASGSYGSYWTNASYSKLAYLVGPGSYSFTIEGNGAGGLPAGLGVRLDNAVPEPATWALMLMGFGGMGLMLRGRREAVAA